MKECELPANTVIGQACRRIPGAEKESCYLWLEAQGEPKKTIKSVESFVERHPECPFKNETLDYIKQQLENLQANLDEVAK
jgi:hypothetical protein